MVKNSSRSSMHIHPEGGKIGIAINICLNAKDPMQKWNIYPNKLC